MFDFTTDQKINVIGIVLIPVLFFLWSAVSKAHRAELSSAEAKGRQAAQAEHNMQAGLRQHKQLLRLMTIVGELRDAMIRRGFLDAAAIERTRSQPPIPQTDTPIPGE
jgi:hypothetical protein